MVLYWRVSFRKKNDLLLQFLTYHCFSLRRAQPDNREQREGGEDEACIAVLNNFYADGIKWHDVNCDHKKPIICEEIPELLDFVNDQ